MIEFTRSESSHNTVKRWIKKEQLIELLFHVLQIEVQSSVSPWFPSLVLSRVTSGVRLLRSRTTYTMRTTANAINSSQIQIGNVLKASSIPRKNESGLKASGAGVGVRVGIYYSMRTS